MNTNKDKTVSSSEIMNTHECKLLAVCCIDFRFQDDIYAWIHKTFPGQRYDLISQPGSTKELDLLLKEVELCISLHHNYQIILIHHEDCGAYGASGTFETHCQALKKAKNTIHKKFPGIDIQTYYLNLKHEFQPVSISK